MKYAQNIFVLWLVFAFSGALAGGGSSGFRPHAGAHVNSHRHHSPVKEGGTKILQDEELLHDKEHLLEDSNNELTREQVENMSKKELEFHYFKLHDFDNNHKLDGLELMAALGHVHQSEEGSEGLNEKELRIVEEMIDAVLQEGDYNHDGYVNYGEYRIGRQKNKVSSLV